MRFYSKLSVSIVSLVFLLSACGLQSRQTSGSSVLGLETFDSESFNGGDTWEYLVNPSYSRDGEQGGETLESSDSNWLAEVDEFAAARENQDLAEYQKSTSAADIIVHNAKVDALLMRATPTAIGYSKNEAKMIYKMLVTQPQVKNHAHYDPEFTIGFCFGRAMIVHGIARNAYVKAGDQTVSKKNVPVRKIWVTGAMGQWKHHVATMVAASEANVGFWVIDNYVGSVMSAKSWMARLTSEFPAANVMFNVTRANRFSEANSLRYYQVMLDDPFFNDFFRDFLKTQVPSIVANGGMDITPPASTESLDTIVSPEMSPGGTTVTPANN